MKSYAQRGEDIVLWRAIGSVKEGFYVDVGAAHPEKDSVTKLFYDLGWHGVNIEPGEQYSTLASARPRDLNLHIAAGPVNGIGKFLCFDGGVGIVADDPDVRVVFEGHGHRCIEMPIVQLSLSRILDDCPPSGGQIHFLKIDVEGYEAEVLQGLDLVVHRPWIIVVEATLPTTEIRRDQIWERQILDNEYECAYLDGLNCFYVADEHEDLKVEFIPF